MATVICVMGESGSGKTTSMRNLPPNETYYIDCDGKGLSWRGWRKDFNEENTNYYRTDFPQIAKKLLDKIDKEQTKYKYVVVDTINGLMVGDEMRRIGEKGYDKWQDLASSVFDIVNDANKYRDDLTVIFLAHSETDRDESGYTQTRIKTNGKKLNKIVLESKFTTVLLSKCIDGKYGFETHAKNSTAKTPLGAFEENFIDNDIMKVIEVLKEY